MYQIVFYQDKDGNAPIRDYIYGLKRRGTTSKNERIQVEKILAYIRALQKYGTRVGTPMVKHIDGNLWELRPLNNRIFFFYWENDTYVLLHHFIKKSQKTPQREIEQARRNLRNFLERSR